MGERGRDERPEGGGEESERDKRHDRRGGESGTNARTTARQGDIDGGERDEREGERGERNEREGAGRRTERLIDPQT